MSSVDDSETAVAEPIVTTRTAPKARTNPDTQSQRQPPYNVVILNDEEHTFLYVIELLMKLFGHPLAKAQELGGSVQVPPMDIPPGRFSVISDDKGAHFAVIKLAPQPAG